MKPLLPFLATCLALTPCGAQVAPPGLPTDTAAQPGIFDRQNLTAWCVVPFDAKKRGPEERAEMLQRLGFKNFAYDWRPKDVPTFDAEVEALNKHGINLLAWWFPTDAGDPSARTILEVIKHHGIHPQLWVMGSGKRGQTIHCDYTVRPCNRKVPPIPRSCESARPPAPCAELVPPPSASDSCGDGFNLPGTTTIARSFDDLFS